MEYCKNCDCDECKSQRKLTLVQTINGIQRYTTGIKDTEDLRRILRRKSIVFDMSKIDEMDIKVYWRKI